MTLKKTLSLPDLKQKKVISTLFLKKIITFLVKSKKKKLLLQLVCGKYKSTCKFLESSHKSDLSFILLAHFEPEKALLKIEKQIKLEPKNEFLLITLAELYLLEHNISKTYLVLEKIFSKDKYITAKKLYLESILALREADMLSVSQKTSDAIKLFNNKGAYFEEGRCYVLLGIAYRASGIYDASQFIFDAALKIYSPLSYSYGVVEVYGNLGMLMSLQNRSDEALAYFDKALSKSSLDVYKAYIFNQKALNSLFNKNYVESEKHLKNALKICKKFEDEIGTAFSYELLSYVKLEEKDFMQAIKYSNKSSRIHQTLTNLSAFLESLYVQALAFYEICDYEKSERLAREILEISEKEQTNFHSANAYNLLGLIFLKKEDYSRAKSLFQKSLSLEQSNERTKGIATDYFNIALADFLIGHKKQALDTLNKALELATEIEDKELVSTITTKINTINQTK
ncbi:MAG: tetratricopeptide repeat protein [Alphaproteobacteria bacterium]